MNKSLSYAITSILIVIIGTIGSILVIAGEFIGWLVVVVVALSYLISKGLQDGISLRERMIGFLFLLKTPLVGFVFALVIGGFIMFISGYNPITSYWALLYGGLYKNWHISVLNATPLIFTGLSVTLAFKCGLFNIGAEGQYYIGAMLAIYLGLHINIPPVLMILIIYITGFVGGSLFNLIPAVMKVKTGAHEVVTTMMLAYIAAKLSSLFIKFQGGNPATSDHAYITDTIVENAWLPRFKEFIPSSNYRLHIGILIAIGLAILVHLFLYRTRLGFEIRTVGAAPETARTQGISVPRTIIITMCLAGGIAAMAGVTQVIGLDHKLFENINAGYGWDGIAVALLAGTSPIGVIFTALLWGILDSGGQFMARTIQTPTSIVEIIKGLVLFLLLGKYLFIYITKRRKK